MKPTDVKNPSYFHKVVDCQWACPAHTNVPEYIRLIAQGRYTDAYMLNREVERLPGHPRPHLRSTLRAGLPAHARRREAGRDLPAQARRRRSARRRHRPAARKAPAKKNGKRIACIGAGPASLTVANDLRAARLRGRRSSRSYAEPGGLMRTNIPSFRLPRSRCSTRRSAMILDMGVEIRYNTPGRQPEGAARRRGLRRRLRRHAARRAARSWTSRAARRRPTNIHIGIDWLASVAFGHIEKIGERVLIIGVGNTAMDCCRTSRRLGGKDIKVMARRPRQYFKASPWELEDAEEEQVEILVNHVAQALRGRERQARWAWSSSASSGTRTRTGGRRRRVIDTVILPADDVILAIGQENAFPWIERDIGIEFDKWDMPIVDETTLQSTPPGRLLRRRRGLGPEEHHLGGRARRTRRPSRSTTTARACRSPSARRTG